MPQMQDILKKAYGITNAIQGAGIPRVDPEPEEIPVETIPEPIPVEPEHVDVDPALPVELPAENIPQPVTQPVKAEPISQNQQRALSLASGIDQEEKNINSYKKGLIKIGLEMYDLKMNQSKIINEQSNMIMQQRNDYFNKINTPVKRELAMVKGEGFKNVLRGLTVGLNVFAGGDMVNRIEADYQKRLQRRDKDLDMYMQLGKEYGDMRIGAQQAKIDALDFLLKASESMIEYEDNLQKKQMAIEKHEVLKGRFLNEITELQNNMKKSARDQVQQKFDNFITLREQNRKELETKIKTSKGKQNDYMEGLKEISKEQDIVDKYRKRRLVGNYQWKAPDGKVVRGEMITGSSDEDAANKAMIEAPQAVRDAKNTLEFIKVLKDAKQGAGIFSVIKKKFTEAAIRYGHKDGYLMTVEQYNDALKTFFGQEKERLGLGRLSDWDAQFISKSLNLPVDGDKIDLRRLTPHALTAKEPVIRNIIEYRLKNIWSIARPQKLEMGSLYPEDVSFDEFYNYFAPQYSKQNTDKGLPPVKGNPRLERNIRK